MNWIMTAFQGCLDSLASYLAAIVLLCLVPAFFIAGKGAIFSGFPASTAEADACTAGGIVVMLWSVAHILREIAKQARFERYLKHQHPDKLPPKPTQD